MYIDLTLCIGQKAKCMTSLTLTTLFPQNEDRNNNDSARIAPSLACVY